MADKQTDTPTPAAEAAEVKAEVAEVKAEAAEVQAEAAQAHRDGDHDRGERLEGEVKALHTKLDGLTEQLAEFVKRPFHPAPEADPEPPAPVPAAEAAPAAEDQPKRKTGGRTMSRGWFGARADAED